MTNEPTIKIAVLKIGPHKKIYVSAGGQSSYFLVDSVMIDSAPKLKKALDTITRAYEALGFKVQINRGVVPSTDRRVLYRAAMAKIEDRISNEKFLEVTSKVIQAACQACG